MVMYKALVKLVDFAVKQVLSMLTDTVFLFSVICFCSVKPLVSKL